MGSVCSGSSSSSVVVAETNNNNNNVENAVKFVRPPRPPLRPSSASSLSSAGGGGNGDATEDHGTVMMGRGQLVPCSMLINFINSGSLFLGAQIENVGLVFRSSISI